MRRRMCETVQKDGKKTQQNCKYKPTIKEYAEKKFPGIACPYYEQKYSGLIEPHSIWNYSSYLQIMKYNKKNYGHYLNKQVQYLMRRTNSRIKLWIL